MDTIINLLKSINFWTIVGVTATLIATVLAIMSSIKTARLKKFHRSREKAIEAGQRLEQTSRMIFSYVERLAEMVNHGTQNSAEGLELQNAINSESAKLRSAALELAAMNPSEFPECRTIQFKGETVYKSFVALLGNGGGNGKIINECINDFAAHLRRIPV